MNNVMKMDMAIINIIINISGWFVLLLPPAILGLLFNNVDLYTQQLIYLCMGAYTTAALFSISYFIMSIKCSSDVAWGIIFEQKLDSTFVSKIPYYILITSSILLAINMNEYILSTIIMTSVVLNSISYTLLSHKASKANYEKNQPS